MFDFTFCKEPDCQNLVVTNSQTCLFHAPDRQKLTADFLHRLQTKEPIGSYAISGIELSNTVLTDLKLYACNMANSVFVDIDFSGSFFQLCFFEFSTFIRCKFTHSVSRYSVFSGSKFIDCDFRDSDILHSNFVGIHAKNCSFDDSDLYYTNFSNAVLEDMTFHDCNLKRTDFYCSKRMHVSFKYSNFEEAIFSQEF